MALLVALRIRHPRGIESPSVSFRLESRYENRICRPKPLEWLSYIVLVCNVPRPVLQKGTEIATAASAIVKVTGEAAARSKPSRAAMQAFFLFNPS